MFRNNLTPLNHIKMEIKKELKNYFIGADEIRNLENLQEDFLVEKLIPKGTLCALVGESDTGKSSLLRQLAISLAYGDKYFLGFKLSESCRNVVYVSTEDSKIGTKNWLDKHLGEDIIQQEKLEKVVFTYLTDNLVHNIKLIAETNCVDLIIVDSYSDLFSGDMNKATEVRAFLNQYNELANIYGVTIVFLHHTKKSSAGLRPNKNSILGSQGFEAKMRSVLMLTKDTKESSLRHLSIIKGNYVDEKEKKESYILKFNENLSFEYTGERCNLDNLENDDYLPLARQMRNDGMTLRQISDALKKLGYEVSKSSLERKLK